MKFAERGDSIMTEMTKVALELITDTHLVALINKFDKDFKNILQHWFGCMRFMMRTGRHTRADITSFRNQREELRVAIINICTDFEPLKLPTTTANPKVEINNDAVIDLGILGSFHLEKPRRTIFEDELLDNEIRTERPSPVFKPQ